MLLGCILAAGSGMAQQAPDGDGTATIVDDGAAATQSQTQQQGQQQDQQGTQRMRASNRGPVTNLPLPRYVSLKGSEGNARRGPSLSHRIDWVFRHAGTPLRVTAEYGHWRRVEDSDGAGGWMHYSLLSGVRTALVQEDMAELHLRPDADSSVTARAQVGAVVKLGNCTREWCEVTGGGVSGWLPKAQIWGVDPGEIRD